MCISIYYSTCESDPVDPKPSVLKPFGYKIDNVKDKAVCVLVNEAPNAKNGIYPNLLACDDALHGLEPKPVDPKPESRPFGFKIDTVKDNAACVLVNEAPNEKNGIYSNLLACQDALHGLEPKPVVGSFGYQFTDKECILVSETPNEKNGVYKDMMDCYKETVRNCNCKK